MQTAFKPFSPKQKLALRWWALPQYRDYDAIICDGAVRSGKTVCMSLGFVCWATTCFQGTAFALCGKTITALRRNVVTPLLQTLQTLGFSCTEKSSRNYVEIALGNRSNRFYLFGGKDEQCRPDSGITLGGVFLDEVALMPRTFVEQALARCSLHTAKMWFNCNPDHPYHWFYREWIQKAAQKRALYLHFTMADNPGLSERVRQRYERLYSGIFMTALYWENGRFPAVWFIRCSLKNVMWLQTHQNANSFIFRAIMERSTPPLSGFGATAKQTKSGIVCRNIITMPEKKAVPVRMKPIIQHWKPLLKSNH